MTFASPQSEILYGNGAKLAETDYGYVPGPVVPANAVSHDETNYGPGSTLARGNVTSMTRVNGSGAPTLMTTAYDETGQVVSQTDPCGTTACSDMTGTNHTTTYSYVDSPVGGNAGGSSNAYPTRVTAPSTGVAHVSSFSYNYTQGLLTESVDQNGHATDYSYSDPLMRLTDSYGPPSVQNNNQRPHTHVAYADGVGASVTTTDPGGIVSVVMLDGMGRATQTQLTSDPSGIDTVDTVYNGVGQVASTSNPYRSKNDPTYGITTSSYDALGRVTQQTNQDNSTEQWNWSGNVVDFHNELGKHWQRTSDAFGDLITVMEPNASNTLAYETDYTYDAQGNLKQADQWGGAKGNAGDRQRTFVYDGLSRLSSSTNPESGTIGYTYDANSNVQTKTDARGVVMTYNYDQLSRMTGKTYTNDPSNTPAVQTYYDAPTPNWTFASQTYPATTPAAVKSLAQSNLVGRASYATNGNATMVYGYDEAGRTVLKSECTPSTCAKNDHYDMHAVYDLAGNTTFADLGVDSARNAATPNAGYYYGGLLMSYANAGKTAGQLVTGTADIVDATHPASIVSGLQYSPLGGVTSESFGSVYGEGNTFSPRGWINTRYGLLANGFERTGTLTHDLAGNVTQQADSLTGTTTYATDQLNRLTSFSNTSAGATYSYDAWGNLNGRTITAGAGYSYSFTITPQNRVSQTGSTDPYFLYDASGDVLSDGLNTYSYDGEARLFAVNGSTQYLYGPDGTRTATVQGGAVTAEYLYNMEGNLATTIDPTGKLVRGALYGGGMHLADYTAGTGAGGGKTEFHLSDEVNSLINTIDQTGAALESCAAGAFGEALNCSPSVDYTENHFADTKRDQESSLDAMGARYYSSTTGRFMSPDFNESGADPDPVPYADFNNPQSLNLYSYAYNNPLTNTDSDGHLPCGGSAIISITVTPGGSEEAQTPDCDSSFNGRQFLQGMFIETGNSFASLGNFLDRNLGKGQNQEPLHPTTGANQQAGATAASIGMFFVPGPEELKGIQLLSRDQLLGEITNPALRRAINDLYRPGASIGNGSTAAALEHELATGELVGGRSHAIKAEQSIRRLTRLLQEQNLSPREQSIAQSILDATENLFGKGPE